MSLTTAAVLTALALDVLLGEFPEPLHPVRWFGRVIESADRAWADPRLAGVFSAAALPVGAAVVVWALVAGTAARTAAGGVGVGAVVLFATTSYRALLETVWRVCRRAESDLASARGDLAALAGRDPSALDADLVRSAALESLAENLADGLVAPLSAFVGGAAVGNGLGLAPGSTLALACGGAAWIKAVNTMDSMWGYPDRPFGTGPARLDDAAMWIPARVTALILASAFLAPRSLARARHWVTDVPSPNAGWPMGTLAAALGVRLEKPGAYVLGPEENLPSKAHVEPALRRVGVAGLGSYACAGVVLWA